METPLSSIAAYTKIATLRKKKSLRNCICATTNEELINVLKQTKFRETQSEFAERSSPQVTEHMIS